MLALVDARGVEPRSSGQRSLCQTAAPEERRSRRPGGPLLPDGPSRLVQLNGSGSASAPDGRRGISRAAAADHRHARRTRQRRDPQEAPRPAEIDVPLRAGKADVMRRPHARPERRGLAPARRVTFLASRWRGDSRHQPASSEALSLFFSFLPLAVRSASAMGAETSHGARSQPRRAAWSISCP